MASVSFTVGGQSAVDSTTRYIEVSVSSDYGSNTASWSMHSTSTTTQQPYTGVWLYINGSLVGEYNYNSNFSTFPTKKDTWASGTAWVPASGSIHVECYVNAGGGSTGQSSEYNRNKANHSGDGWLTKVGTPSINNPSMSEIGRTSAKCSFSVSDNGGASIVDNYIDCATSNFSGVVSTINSTSGTFTGLTSNTTYYVRANASNGSYRGYSNVISFKTDHNAPTIGTRTYSYSRAASSLGSTYTATLNYSVSYDNASYSSRKIEYGTSTSYGSSVTNTKSISGLAPNKTYYYKITENDNSSKSSTATGSFTTPGIAPTISVSASPSRTTCTLTGTISYDTNDSYSSRSIQYGTTTSYGSTSTSESLSSLTPNTTYYYKYTVNSSAGKSNYATGSFKTTGNNPIVDSVTTTPARTTCSFDISVTYDTNASFSSRTIEYGTSTSYGSSVTGTSITNLTPNTKYYYRVRITDNQSRTSSWKTGNFTTTGNIPVITAAGVNNIKSKTATINTTATFDTNASLNWTRIDLRLNGTQVRVISSHNANVDIDDLKPGKNYTALVTVEDNWSRVSEVTELTFKTKGGFKFNGRMSDSARFNGKEVVGMKFNGVEII